MTNANHQTDSYVSSGTSPPAADAQHHKQSAYIAEGFKNRTYGERKFNMRTYIGLGYVGSLAASIGLTFLLRDVDGVWPKYQMLTDKITAGVTKAVRFVTRTERTAEETKRFAERMDSNMTILSMFTGTTLMAILPIKFREDRKAEIVKQYDRDHYGEARVATDPEIQEAHALIEAAPKQTWKSVLSSRIVAFAATMGVATLIGSNASTLSRHSGFSLDKWSVKWGRGIDKFFRGGNKDVVAQIEAAARNLPHEIARAQKPSDTKLSRLYSYLTLDAVYTVMTGGLLYISTRIFAPMFDNTLKERTEALPAHIQAEIGKSSYRPLTAHEKPSTAVPQALPSSHITAAQLDARVVNNNEMAPHATQIA